MFDVRLKGQKRPEVVCPFLQKTAGGLQVVWQVRKWYGFAFTCRAACCMVQHHFATAHAPALALFHTQALPCRGCSLRYGLTVEAAYLPMIQLVDAVQHLRVPR